MSLPLIGVKTYRIGGNTPSLNLTAAGSIVGPANALQTRPGMVGRFIVGAPGSTGGAFTLNDTNAYVAAQTVSAITAANPGVVTISTSSSANPFAVGNQIAFTSIGGMTQLLPLVGTVTAIGGTSTAWTITTNINTTSFSAYTSGGTVASFSAANQIWSLAYNATANVAGAIFTLEFPFNSGLVLSAVPSAGSPVCAVSYD
jgi:hypothetical protein